MLMAYPWKILPILKDKLACSKPIVLCKPPSLNRYKKSARAGMSDTPTGGAGTGSSEDFKLASNPGLGQLPPVDSDTSFGSISETCKGTLF